MTARLLVAALALVAFATQPRAFDLLALKRAALLLTALPLLFTQEMAALFVRPVRGPLGWLAYGAAAAGVIALPAIGWATAEDWRGPSVRVHLQAFSELWWFVLAALLAREVAWERAGTLLRGVAGVAALLALLALLQVAGFDPLYGATSPQLAVATFGNTNAFAAFAAIGLGVAVAFATRSTGGRLGSAATVLLAAALVVARGRGGWLAGAIGALGALLVAARTGHSWRRGAVALALGVLLGLGVAVAAGGRSEGAAKPLGIGLERSSNLVRLDVARASLDLIGEAPWLGHGPGAFRDAYPRHRVEREARTTTREGAASEVDHPHDEWLRLAADFGVVVTALIALGWLAALLAAAKGSQVARADDGTLRAAAVGGIVAWLAASLTWSTLHDPPCALLGAILLGAAVAGVPEVAPAHPRSRWLGLPMRLAIAIGLALLGWRTPIAEWIEWEATRDQRIDLATFQQIAELDVGNVERQYAIGTLLLQEARKGPKEAAATLPLAKSCFDRALWAIPHHAGSLAGRAAVAAALESEFATREWLARLHRLEPWRGAVEAALADLLAASGAELEAARLRLAHDGAAAIAPLAAEAKQLLDRGKTRQAAQLLDLLAPAAPDDGEVLRLLGLTRQALGDERGYRRAYAQSQQAFALEALAGGEADRARGNLALARKVLTELAQLPLDGEAATADDSATTTALTTVELLEACVDLQKNRSAESNARLSALAPGAVATAKARATPAVARWLALLGAAAPLAEQARRLGLAE